MLQKISSVFVVYRRKTLTGSPDPTHANGTDKPCKCKMTYIQLYADNYEIITIISLPFHNASYNMKWKLLKYIYMKCINVHIALNSLFSYSPAEMTRLIPLTTSFTRSFTDLQICCTHT